jgi:hypothetical protein
VQGASDSIRDIRPDGKNLQKPNVSLGVYPWVFKAFVICMVDVKVECGMALIRKLPRRRVDEIGYRGCCSSGQSPVAGA